MQPLPTPCPPGLVPDATDVDAFNAACRRAKQQHQVFVAVEEQGRRWPVKADTHRGTGVRRDPRGRHPAHPLPPDPRRLLGRLDLPRAVRRAGP
ncbi:hypothetical protein OHS70_33020 [Streptomyces sp. NBC_00390]|uniref:hypothetical protein n=1 Tax=Streptomyces sp. NBC_00390 TaxID=2975736 RepID=UPI002E1B0DA5